ncbi:MAG: DUF502 domain-containing protein [Bdellovibrionales bacterium]|nr:DUF502 domain-containing protein [Bdellovibrionales bacterium]
MWNPKPSPFPNLRALLRSNLIAGLMIVIPLGVIAWMVFSAGAAVLGLREWIPSDYRPENLIQHEQIADVVNYLIGIVIFLVLALLISLIGWTSKQYLGKKVFALIAEVIQRIPVLRSVYSALDQLLRTIASGKGQQFSRVVYLEYPRKGTWAIAFVTAPAKGIALGDGYLNVYVPTTPNPTSGFHLLVHESEVKDSHLKVEEAFRMILSLGIAQPTHG